MKLLSIILLIGFASITIYWAFISGGPVYMWDLNGKIRKIPDTKSDHVAIVVIIVFTLFGIIQILSNS